MADNEVGKSNQSALAIAAILNLYSFEQLDDDTVNSTLQTYLPEAYPQHFTLHQGKLALIGTEIPCMLRALGIPLMANNELDIKIDCRAFEWVELEDLRMTFPHERSVWSILKSLKPIDPLDERFSVVQKVDACCEVLKELSMGRVLVSDPQNHALHILNYAGRVVRDSHDAVQINRLRNYVSASNPADSEEIAKFKTWILEELKNKHMAMTIPDTLKNPTEDIQIAVQHDKTHHPYETEVELSQQPIMMKEDISNKEEGALLTIENKDDIQVEGRYLGIVNRVLSYLNVKFNHFIDKEGERHEQASLIGESNEKPIIKTEDIVEEKPTEIEHSSDWHILEHLSKPKYGKNAKLRPQDNSMPDAKTSVSFKKE